MLILPQTIKKTHQILNRIESMLILPQELTRTLAVRDLAGPLVDKTLRATSAAACSACLNVVQ